MFGGKVGAALQGLLVAIWKQVALETGKSIIPHQATLAPSALYTTIWTFHRCIT